MKRVTVIVPSVPPAFRTVWHPVEEVGPFSTLCRGDFASVDDAITWAREHLNGTPYSLRLI